MRHANCIRYTKKNILIFFFLLLLLLSLYGYSLNNGDACVNQYRLPVCILGSLYKCNIAQELNGKDRHKKRELFISFTRTGTYTVQQWNSIFNNNFWRDILRRFSSIENNIMKRIFIFSLQRFLLFVLIILIISWKKKKKPFLSFPVVD